MNATPSNINLQYAGHTDVGKKRQNNEDVFICQPIWDGQAILAVAIDGMGGYEGGEVAASIARHTILQFLECHVDADSEETLKHAFVAANNAIREERRCHPEFREMACVATALLVVPSRWTVQMAHVGDTRCYLLHQGELKKLSHDHSPIGAYEEQGILSEEEAMAHPMRNMVQRCLGFRRVEESARDFVEHSRFALLPDSKWLLCSDGLTDMLKSAQVKQILERNTPPAETVADLIEAANEAGGKDNVTAVLIQVSGGPCPDSTGMEEKDSLITASNPGGGMTGESCMEEADSLYSMPLQTAPGEGAEEELRGAGNLLETERKRSDEKEGMTADAVEDAEESTATETPVPEIEADRPPRAEIARSMPAMGMRGSIGKGVALLSLTVLLLLSAVFLGSEDERIQNPCSPAEPVTASVRELDPSDSLWINPLLEHLEAHVADIPVGSPLEKEMAWMSDFRDELIHQVNTNVPELADSDFIVKSDYVYHNILVLRSKEGDDGMRQDILSWKHFLQYADWLTLKDSCRTIVSKNLLQEEMEAWSELYRHLVNCAQWHRPGQTKQDMAGSNAAASPDRQDSTEMCTLKIKLLSARSTLLRNDLKTLKKKQEGKPLLEQAGLAQDSLIREFRQLPHPAAVPAEENTAEQMEQTIQRWHSIHGQWTESVSSSDEIALYRQHTEQFLQSVLEILKEDAGTRYTSPGFTRDHESL